MKSIEAAPSTVVAMLFRSVGVVALLAVPAISGLGSLGAPAPGGREGAEQPSTWRAAWSERYPGCVPAALWPQDERPVAVVTKAPDGSIERVALDGGRRPVHQVPAGAHTIGVCR